MTVAELIRELQTLGIEAQDLPVTRIFDDFPTDIKRVEIVSATEPYSERKSGAGYWYESFAPESEEVPVVKIVVLR